jgi:hypothetical protein
MFCRYTFSQGALDRDKDATLSNALLPNLDSLTLIFNDKPRFSFSILVDMVMSRRQGMAEAEDGGSMGLSKEVARLEGITVRWAEL